MSNIIYTEHKLAETLSESPRGRIMLEFLQRVAPKRPQFKFVVPSTSECYVYHGVVDITCKDWKSVNYVGGVGFAGLSRRGGKGWRSTIIVVPAGRSRHSCKETVSIPRAAKNFLDNFEVRDLAAVVNEAANHAAGVVGKLRGSARHNILNNLQDVVTKLADLELARYIPALLRGEGTPGLALNHVPKIEEEATEMLELCKVFGARNELAACVLQSGETYVVKHKDALMEYTRETLPSHIACAIGMLKLAGCNRKFLPGYGVLVADDIYAVSIEEVGL
jgi:hypothetical protein